MPCASHVWCAATGLANMYDPSPIVRDDEPVGFGELHAHRARQAPPESARVRLLAVLLMVRRQRMRRAVHRAPTRPGRRGRGVPARARDPRTTSSSGRRRRRPTSAALRAPFGGVGPTSALSAERSATLAIDVELVECRREGDQGGSESRSRSTRWSGNCGPGTRLYSGFGPIWTTCASGRGGWASGIQGASESSTTTTSASSIQGARVRAHVHRVVGRDGVGARPPLAHRDRRSGRRCRPAQRTRSPTRHRAGR